MTRYRVNLILLLVLCSAASAFAVQSLFAWENYLSVVSAALVGALDSGRLVTIQESALAALERSRVRSLILDISAVPVIDTQVTQGLIRVTQSARLLGANVILVGIRPEVAQAIVGLGVELGNVATRSTLADGIAYALR